MNNINFGLRGVDSELHEWFVDPKYLEIKPEEYQWQILLNR